MARYQLDAERLAANAANAVVMQPGPVIRGLEMTDEVADGAQSAIEEQVTQGLAVRRALLARALGVRPWAETHTDLQRPARSGSRYAEAGR